MTRFLRHWLLTALAALLPMASVQAQGDYGLTHHPIVLVHGLFGFGAVLGIDYFYGIPEALRQGGAQVHVARVSPAHSTEVRGEQLLAQVKTILALTGATKVNLIGHSHGGLTARYVAGVAPELVASVTAIGAPHKGSRLADLLHNAAPEGSLTATLALGAANALLATLELLSTDSRLPQLPQLPRAALDAFTLSGSRDFTRRFPQGVPDGCGDGAERVDGVRYYSWTGITPRTNLFDASDLVFGLLGQVFGEPNDGLVSACSSRLGKHLGDYRQNHLDEINQMLGLRDAFSIDPVLLYRQHAHRLQQAGL